MKLIKKKTKKKFNRNSKAWKDIRVKALVRDKYRCKICNSNKTLECHHIIPVSFKQELALDISNIIVLCVNCHRLVRFRELVFSSLFSKIVKGELLDKLERTLLDSLVKTRKLKIYRNIKN